MPATKIDNATLPIEDVDAALAKELTRAGFYPEVVSEILKMLLSGEKTISFLVQPEMIFSEAVHRHLTVLVLTPGRLLIVHADDASAPETEASAAVVSEIIPIAQISSVTLTHGIDNPMTGGRISELTLAICWGAVRRFELEPTACGEPACTADHGLSGISVPDDLVVRVCADVEGESALGQAQKFADALCAATARTSKAL